MKKRPIIITTTNAITIPKKVRNLLDLQPGDCLDYEVMAMVQSFWYARNVAIRRRSVQHANFPARPKNVNNLNGWWKGLPNPFLQL